MRLDLVLLAGALALAGGVAAWGVAERAHAGDTATFALAVTGPDGPLLDDSIATSNATALALLQAGAAKHAIPLALETYPGMGTYVRAIGPYRANGGSGWVYEVEHEGNWTSGDRSAAFYPLAKGDAVRWSWTTG